MIKIIEVRLVNSSRVTQVFHYWLSTFETQMLDNYSLICENNLIHIFTGY